MRFSDMSFAEKLLIALAAGSGMFFITRGLESGSKLVVNDIDLSAAGDGTYIGRYKAGRWTNEMSVTVKDHKITGISVVKDVLFSKPGLLEELAYKVIEKQSIEVDSVSGASVTSKAYLKSVENALKK